MWTQRDQIQAYQFLRRRLVSALVSADANHPVSPSRRLMFGTVLGLAAALVLTAAFGVLRVLKPSSGDSWKKPGQVVIEKETGTRYVLTGDGLLHPVLNFASARLLAGGDGSKTSTVSAKTLASVGRGGLLGISGAPDSLPATKRLSAGPITTCTDLPADRAGDVAAQAVLRWGSTPAGRQLSGSQGLLVSDGSDTEIVTSGHRFRLPGDGVLAALGLEGKPVTKVAPAWLSAVPPGADLALLAVGQAGTAGPRVGGRDVPVGSVLQVGTTTGKAYYLALPGGIAPMSAVQAALVLSNPANRVGGARPTVIVVGADQLTGVVRTELPEQLRPSADAQAPPTLTDLPALVRLPSSSTPLCLVLDPAHGGADNAGLMVPDSASAVTAGALAPAGSTDTQVADLIVVPASTGALVRVGSVGAATTTYLITDTGFKYPVGTTDAQAALGYGRQTPVSVPAATVALLPTGPVLSADAARQSVVATGK